MFFLNISKRVKEEKHEHSLIGKSRPYRVARVVGEVDLGESHVNDKYFHAHNAALIAVFVLGNNGHLGFS